MNFIMLTDVREASGGPNTVVNLDHVVMMRKTNDGHTVIFSIQKDLNQVAVKESMQEIYSRSVPRKEL